MQGKFALSSAVLLLSLIGCGSASRQNSALAPDSEPAAALLAHPEITHVFVVVLENAGYAEAIGNAAMPYLNGLAGQGSLATNYYAVTHPSIGNYEMMTAGQVITNNDGFTGTIAVDNVVRHLVANGMTWKGYAQSIPSAGYVGPDVYPYAQRHNPLSYFSDVRDTPAQRANLVPLTELAADMSAGSLPNYAMIVPDLNHDGHDCPVGRSSCTLTDKLAAADEFLQQTAAPLLADADFLAHGVLIVVFDEGMDTDSAHGGGHVSTVLAGARIRAGYESAELYQHQNLARFTLEALGLTSFPGQGETAASMREFLIPEIRLHPSPRKPPNPRH